MPVSRWFGGLWESSLFGLEVDGNDGAGVVIARLDPTRCLVEGDSRLKTLWSSPYGCLREYSLADFESDGAGVVKSVISIFNSEVPGFFRQNFHEG
jgi:hypothetical protein